MMFGYSDGSVSFQELFDADEDNINRLTNQMKNAEELRLSGMIVKKYEHKDRILNIDCSIRKLLFLTCG